MNKYKLYSGTRNHVQEPKANIGTGNLGWSGNTLYCSDALFEGTNLLRIDLGYRWLCLRNSQGDLSMVTKSVEFCRQFWVKTLARVTRQ
jgi:hypothetical protein